MALSILLPFVTFYIFTSVPFHQEVQASYLHLVLLVLIWIYATTLVAQWLSNVYLQCWPYDGEGQKYSLSDGEGESHVLCALETFWIVASGSADTFEEMNMFVL